MAWVRLSGAPLASSTRPSLRQGSAIPLSRGPRLSRHRLCYPLAPPGCDVACRVPAVAEVAGEPGIARRLAGEHGWDVNLLRQDWRADDVVHRAANPAGPIDPSPVEDHRVEHDHRAPWQHRCDFGLGDNSVGRKPLD